MLVFTNSHCLTPEIVYNQENVIYNLSSYIEGFERVNILPPFGLDRYSREFDLAYEEYIRTNDSVFMEFMKIIMSLYNGYNVIILVDMNSPIFTSVTESLIILFEQKYDLIPNIVQELEDWDSVEEYSFSERGINNLLIEKERYSYIIEAMNLYK